MTIKISEEQLALLVKLLDKEVGPSAAYGMYFIEGRQVFTSSMQELYDKLSRYQEFYKLKSQLEIED